MWLSPIQEAFISNENAKEFCLNEDLLLNICNEAQHLEDMQIVFDIIWIELRSYIRSHTIPKFWDQFICEIDMVHFKTPFAASLVLYKELEQPFLIFVAAVTEISRVFKNLKNILEKLIILLNNTTKSNEEIPVNFDIDILKEYFLETLLAGLPSKFIHFVYAFNLISFQTFETLQKNVTSVKSVEDMELSPKRNISNSSNMENLHSDCVQRFTIIEEVNQKLRDMGMLDRIAGQTITTLVQSIIREYINTSCIGVFDKSNLVELELWVDNVVSKWLARTFNYESSQSDIENSSTDSFYVKLKYFLYESFALSMIDQFFNIIIEFPDSIPAIDDLKTCMGKIDMRKQLVSSLKSSLEARILHPGVNTIDILTGYIAAIKAIRYLDKSGIILNTVTAPIKEYLRKRSDTVRRVVTGLTEEGPTDLSEELAKGEILKENANSKANEEINWETWVPEPFGLENCNQSISSNRSADIISMVVDIYGSKELFMNEYRNLMADRLLSQLDFNSDKEIRNLELLKIRFGEVLLHSCEVMLKDVTDSKRINAHIQSDSTYNEEKKFDISSLIISAQFWPLFNKENLELPEEIATEFQKYTKSYEAYKGNRTLHWRNVTGKVNIEIELGDKKLEMTVPPTQAVLIYHFQNKDEWSLEELSNIMKVPCTILRRRINFWQQHGLIFESSPDMFKLIEETKQPTQFDSKPSNLLGDEEEDIESAMASASDQREEELQVFWSYIVGMLTNLDSLPLERIHQMLKLFASQGVGTEFSQDELKDFLQRKVREHQLIISGGVYQLPK